MNYYNSKIELRGDEQQLIELKNKIDKRIDLIVSDNNDLEDISSLFYNNKLKQQIVYFKDAIRFKIITKNCPSLDYFFCVEKIYGLLATITIEEIDDISEFDYANWNTGDVLD